MRLGWDVVLWEPCARMPGYLALCVYVSNGGREENHEKGCVHPGHPLLITLQSSLRISAEGQIGRSVGRSAGRLYVLYL